MSRAIRRPGRKPAQTEATAGPPPIDRRSVLRTGLLAAALAPLWASGTARALARRERILVIGAGMAGLAAARELAVRGFQVVILEGRQRLGGRIWTDRSLGTAIDMGAAWIEGTRGNPIQRLADEAGVATIRSNLETLYVYDADGRRISDATFDDHYDRWEELLSEVQRYAETLDRDVSVAAAIDALLRGETLTPFERRLLHWFEASVELDTAEDLSRVSLFSFDEDEAFGGPDVIFRNGYDQLVEHLAGGLDVRRDHKVVRIERRPKGVRVVTERGAFTADAAVVTLPLGVLKSGRVAFTPQLPAPKRQAIQRLGMGVANRVVLRFPRAFWARNREALAYVAHQHGELPVFLDMDHYVGEPILVGFWAGSAARAVEGLSEGRVVGRALGVLRRIYGGNVPDPVGAAVTRWGRDPFSFGSYSHVPVGASLADYRRLAEPVAGRLFFAGEATSDVYPATVHGAFLTGIREAERIDRQFT